MFEILPGYLICVRHTHNIATVRFYNTNRVNGESSFRRGPIFGLSGLFCRSINNDRRYLASVQSFSPQTIIFPSFHHRPDEEEKEKDFFIPRSGKKFLFLGEENNIFHHISNILTSYSVIIWPQTRSNANINSEKLINSFSTFHQIETLHFSKQMSLASLSTSRPKSSKMCNILFLSL